MGAILAYGIVCVLTPDTFRILDSVDLAIHETGHLVFGFMGEFLMFLGGTLFQLIVPAAFVAYFWRRHDHYAAGIVLFWVAQNCWNIARYVEDARAQELPLVGGGEHAWASLLGTLGWLQHDQTIGALIRIAGFLLLIYSVGLAWLNSAAVPEAEPSHE